MPELYLPPQGDFEVRISPALAVALSLPLVDLAPKFPGLEPWLVQLPGRLGRAARADVRLLSVPLSGALAYLLEAPDDEESFQPALDLLRSASPEEIQTRVVRNLARRSDKADEAEIVRWLHEEPARLKELIRSMGGPSADEAFVVDAERAVALIAAPVELKQLVEFRLQQLWHDHFAERWREALPTARALARAARSRFHLGDAELVAQEVLGRRLSSGPDWAKGGKFVFCPVPFLGPYLAIATEEHERRVLYIGFGVARGVDDVAEATHRDLLASLRVLADEARLNVVDYVRRHGRACASDLMERFGWSQPATSRHLRALESVGLLDVQRVDGIKWYSINTSRAKRIVRDLDRFLTEE